MGVASRTGPKAGPEDGRALGPMERTVVVKIGLILLPTSWLFAPSFGLEQAAALVC